jgi:hypothetical protein
VLSQQGRVWQPAGRQVKTLKQQIFESTHKQHDEKVFFNS